MHKEEKTVGNLMISCCNVIVLPVVYGSRVKTALTSQLRHPCPYHYQVCTRDPDMFDVTTNQLLDLRNVSL